MSSRKTEGSWSKQANRNPCPAKATSAIRIPNHSNLSQQQQQQRESERELGSQPNETSCFFQFSGERGRGTNGYLSAKKSGERTTRHLRTTTPLLQRDHNSVRDCVGALWSSLTDCITDERMVWRTAADAGCISFLSRCFFHFACIAWKRSALEEERAHLRYCHLCWRTMEKD